MSKHLCTEPTAISWKQIQRQITGQWRMAGNYTCGACSLTFETICVLHFHCMWHSKGGSYFFDHETNTAYPRLRVKCSFSQVEEYDLKGDDLKILIGHAVPINPDIEIIDETEGNLHHDITENDMNNFSLIDKSTRLDESSTTVVIQKRISNKSEPENIQTASETSMGNMETGANKTPVNDSSSLTSSAMVVTDCDMPTKGEMLESNLVKRTEQQNCEHSVAEKVVSKQSLARIQSTENGLNLLNHQKSSGCQKTSVLRRFLTDSEPCCMHVLTGLNEKVEEKNKYQQKDMTKDGDPQNVEVKKRGRKKRSDLARDEHHFDLDPTDNEKVDESPSVSLRSSRKRKITAKLQESGYANIMSSVRKEIEIENDDEETNKSKESQGDSSDKIKVKRKTGGLKHSNARNLKKKVKKALDNLITSEAEETVTDCTDVDKFSTNEAESETRSATNQQNEEKMSDEQTEVINESKLLQSTEKRKQNMLGTKSKNSTKTNPRLNKNSGSVNDKPKKLYTCNVCGKKGTAELIKYHKEMHSDKTYECEICRKVLKTPLCLKSHMKTHSEKKFVCDQCPATFNRKCYLESHMNKHKGFLPHMCDLCGQKFTELYILRRHIDSYHNNIRKYECDICKKTFFRQQTRKNHRKRHFEATLQCSQCPRKFKLPADLRKHEFCHSGEKQFFCPLCNHGFALIAGYYKHMRNIHDVKSNSQAKEMRIRNPNIVNMRNINEGTQTKEWNMQVKGQTVTAIPERKHSRKTVLNIKDIPLNNINSEQHVLPSTEQENSFVENSNEGTTELNSEEICEFQDAIILDLGDSIDGQETIVIHAEDIQCIENGEGYIVVDETQSGGNIVI